MISLLNPARTIMSPKQRERAIDLLAQRYLDGMSGRDLERFFLDIQTDYLTSYNDAELLSELEDYMEESEYEEFVNEP